MVDAGYSGTALIKKLGKPEMKILVMEAPANYFQLLIADIEKQYISKKGIPDLIHLFAKDNVVFKQEMKTVLNLCKKNSSLIVWVSWYKKSSGVYADLSEGMIREFALQHNLFDVKICTVSNKWSGLKLVVPLAKR